MQLPPASLASASATASFPPPGPSGTGFTRAGQDSCPALATGRWKLWEAPQVDLVPTKFSRPPEASLP